MRTYGELFRTREFTPLFAISGLQVTAQTMAGLALGTLVFARTGSPLLAALSMFGSSFAQLVGAVALLSAADRLPPRAAAAAMALMFAAATAVLAIPGLPLWAVFVLLLSEGLVASLYSAVRYGLITEILPREGFVLGRSVLNMSTGLVQIVGFVAGGLLLDRLSPRGVLLAGAALFLTAAGVAATGLTSRPARAGGSVSVAETWRTNRVLLSSRERLPAYLALWVPNGLIVGCESLFVPYAPSHAGLLFAMAAAGMLAGDTVMGRFVAPRWRSRVNAPLRLLLAVPYLAMPVHPPLAIAVVVVTVASFGYSASLLLQERLVMLTPEEMSGQGLGLQLSGIFAMQGVGAALAGGIAQVSSPAVAMGAMALASSAVTLALAPRLKSVSYKTAGAPVQQA
ncbi:MFS transporter [Actinomadura parmotrematis]|uniref:MFS transporter n=1 Tax=Actinomadura parmotrematis TaxID=2864039 RepID=A0ABS7G6R1_9ACTN|nr:MFS transporter [Actinomadura parmotrematis]MBW8487313.1 MFS transporter [Actinomadura parmotrematis]